MTPLSRFVTEHVLYALRNATVHLYPFPHFFAQNVFPAEYYYDLLAQLPTDTDYHSGAKDYNGRLFSDPTRLEGLQGFITQHFLTSITAIFRQQLKEKFGNQNIEVFTDLRLIRDGEGYFIGPHTDARWKLISLLFYLPYDESYAEHGTSIYTPNTPTFLCEGGPHHEFEDFTRIFTAPFLPNTCFGFWKTPNAFHGVEPVPANITRDILLWNLYDKKLHESLNTVAPPAL